MSFGNSESKGGKDSGGKESPGGEGGKKSAKGVTGLGEKMEAGGGEGSGREADIRSPGGTAEESGERVNDEEATGAVEAKGVASSRACGNSSRLISAVVLLHTSQEGSGHSS